MLKKRKKKGHKIYNKYIYEVCFKKKQGLFFCKLIVGYKSEKGIIEDLNFFLIKKKEE